MDNIDLIRKIAWSFHHSTGLEWEDLFQEAAYAYCESIQTHQPDKGKVTTHIWHCVTNHLKNYIKAQRGPEYIPLDALRYSTTSPSYFFESLSEDAYHIAKMILRASKKFVVLDLKQVEERLIVLLHQQGWSAKRIATALVELENACTSQ